MAIDPKKLLPPSKITSSLVAPSFSGLSINKQSAEVRKVTELSKKYNEQNIDIMRRSLLDVDALIKSVLGENRTTEENKRRRREREEFEERESRLELPREQKKFRLPQVSLPGMSFLDRVKRFLLFTGIGWLFSNFQSQLPKLLGIIKIITPIYGVVDNVFKFILSSVVNFIDRGYETYDKIRALVKSVGGDSAQQNFDALSSKLNEYINYILIGGMALTGAIAAFTANVSKIRAPQPQPRPVPAPARPIAAGGKPGTSVATATAKSGGKLAQRALAKNLIRTTVKPVLARLPIVGALIEFGLSWALGDPVSKAAFRGIGSLLVGAVGTAIGGPIGTAIGGLVGGEVGGRVYDILFGGNKPPAYRNGGRVIRAYAKGGGVLGTYELGRTIEVKRAIKPTPPVQPTLPGSDVGGVGQIQRIYPSPMDFRKPNPYNALADTSKDLKSTPYGLGALMGGAIDVALGQKLSNSTILNASAGLENMFYDNYNREENFIDVRSIIFGVIKSAADSALMNVRDELGKGKKKEEKKTEEEDGREPGPGTPMPGQAIRVPSQGNLPPLPPTGTLAGGVQAYGASRRGGRKHAGVDFDAGPNDTFYSRIGGVVKYIGNDPGGYYKYVDIYNKELGVTERIAEGDNILVSVGQTITPGTPVAQGTNTTGVFHYEIRKGANTTYGFANTVDPIAFLKNSSVKTDDIASTPSGVGNVGKWGPLMQLIASKESGGNYEAMYPSTTLKGATKMTIAEVARKATGAVGKYQQLPQYLVGRAKAAGLNPDKDLYSPANQDLIAAKVNIGQNRGGNQWLAGKLKTEDFMQGLSQEFAVLPNAQGRFAYGGQSSSITPDQVKSALEKIKKAKLGGLADSISPSGNYVLPKDSSTDTKLLEQYPSYSEGGMRTRLAVQRVIIEKVKPIPMPGNSKTSFAIAGGGVNNSMALNRG
jgi:hypothetical protein